MKDQLERKNEKSRRFFSNNLGSVTIVLLILLGLFTSLFYAILQLNTLRYTNQRVSQQIAIVESVTSEINILLKKDENCKANILTAFGNTGYTSINQISSQALNDPRLFKVGLSFSSSDLLGTWYKDPNSALSLIKLDKMTFSSMVPNEGVLTLAFRKNAPTHGPPIITKTIFLEQFTGDDDEITCASGVKSFGAEIISDFCEQALDDPHSGLSNACETFYLGGQVTMGKLSVKQLVSWGLDTDVAKIGSIDAPGATANIKRNINNVMELWSEKNALFGGSLSTTLTPEVTLNVRDTLTTPILGGREKVCFGASACSGDNGHCLSAGVWSEKICKLHSSDHSQAGKREKLVSISRNGDIICAPLKDI